MNADQKMSVDIQIPLTLYIKGIACKKQKVFVYSNNDELVNVKEAKKDCLKSAVRL